MSNYPLRLPDNILSEAKALAARNGTSLNQFLVALIAERVGEMKALTAFQARAARGKADAALAVLAKVPDVPPVDGDEV